MNNLSLRASSLIRCSKLLMAVVFVLCLSAGQKSYAQICDNGTMTFTLDFTGHPDTVFTTGDISRNGSCCGNTSSTCILFDMTLDAKTLAVVIDIPNGALPTGSFFLQLDCGPPQQFQKAICINTPGHHTLTFCKPGNNTNNYSVTAISMPTFPASDTARIGCSALIKVKGLLDSTITWQSVYPGNPGDYNSYLSCTSKCSQSTFTPLAGAPEYIDYKICGMITAANCAAGVTQAPICKIVRMYVKEGVKVSVDLSSVNLTCLQPSADITASASFETSLLWSNGATTPAINVTAAGIYTVTATSTSAGCTTAKASAQSTVTTDFSTPQLSCANSLNLTCANPSGTLRVSTVQGVAFLWSGPGIVGDNTGSAVTVNAPGVYTVVATKTSSGCTETCSVTVTQDISSPNLACGSGDNLTCTHTSGSIGVTAATGVTFLWSGPGIVGANDGSNITVNLAGVYTVIATKTSSGCTETCSITVTSDFSTPALQCGNGDVITCAHPTGSIGVTSAAGVTLLWSGPGIIGSKTGNSINVNAAGIYTVVATKTSSGCTQSCSITVTSDFTVFPANAGPDKLINCLVTKVNLEAPPIPTGVTYKWTAINGGHIYLRDDIAGPLADAAGCYVLTTTYMATGCISRDTACVTGNTTKPACNISSSVAVPDSNTAGYILKSNATGTDKYAWSVKNYIGNKPWVITSDTTSAYITYTSGTGGAMFTLTVTNNLSGCTSTCTFAISVNGTKYCMYGQGAYGNAGGKHCDNTNTRQFMTTLLNTPLVLGGGNNTITFTKSDVNCMISRLPGGGDFDALNGVATCSNPVGIKLFTNGRFRNGLLSQTITLGLNLRICDIGNKEIITPYIVTFGSGDNGCCNAPGINQGTTRTTVFSLRVYNYLKTLLGRNPTFNDVYEFANQALAGTYAPKSIGDPRLPDIAGAADAINTAFAGCAILAGFSDGHMRIGYTDEVTENSDLTHELEVKVYPNPFSNQSIIEMNADVDYNRVVVELFNVNGARVRVLYDGAVTAGETYNWKVDGSTLAEGIYMYRIIADDINYNGKMVLIRQ